MMSTPAKGTALITGASSGIGAIYAARLATRGFDLCLVARNAERLDAAAQQARSLGAGRVEAVVADLVQDKDLRGIEDLLRTRDDISLLVNNAGIGAVTPLLGTSVETVSALIDLNITALARLAYAAAPAFVGRGQGTIINISSAVAIYPEMLNGVYGASKAFVLALTQSMHHELSDKGLRVQAVLPGATATEFWNAAGLPHENLPSEIVMRGDDMVDAALSGLDAGEVITIPALADASEWERYDGLRRDLSGQLSRSEAAARYRSAP